MAATEIELTPDQRLALETELRTLADDEFVLAERYTEWQVHAPTLESDLALANIAQDELGHARLWYDLLEELGYDETDLLWERDPDTFRHATLSELPFPEGEWADAIVRSYLFDVAEGLRLESLEESAYPAIADRVGKIQREEGYHTEHAENWLERLATDDEGGDHLQAAVDRLFPHALALFVPTEPVPFGAETVSGDGAGSQYTDTDALPDAATVEETIVAEGYRTDSLATLGERWLDRVVPTLESHGLRTPVPADGEITDELVPDACGRNGRHTDDWDTLYADFTHTYRELGREDATMIMDRPE
ncbi:phenylacetate-CoA oxygenase subunit PaaI [Halovivax asiaticus JCM 14624]|uniref:Phenylacetate-CoA oxygenase subunit PaaI n=1 Tax=Halovivax asiaticus JCM 14624 TaxID=1227490 RepID=M0BX95_9EURY|nr:1,2-phenylacetyl-CoA epoxidase subunit PaaC [Halovivax asiaticus]ELZ14299.1 phenylacetate-CoA oxygenase subunit PaaI [Halovivax asiaticus JCM 14624]